MSLGKRVSWTRVDFPLPETPVTQVKSPRGMATSTPPRLWPRAFLRTIHPVVDMWTKVYTEGRGRLWFGVDGWWALVRAGRAGVDGGNLGYGSVRPGVKPWQLKLESTDLAVLGA